jgi:hypothetical protein
VTVDQETAADVFGLSGTFPRPGWVVLDAARDHRFTGELVLDASPDVHLFLDRGTIYLAERAHDPSLGARLVDAGALNAAQLEHGAMRVGDFEHLGRLFERVPSVDRQVVFLTTELMNDECVAWVARRHVSGVTAHPYQHHPSGVHRWNRPVDVVDLQPGDPLPAPAPTDTPVALGSATSATPADADDTPVEVIDREPLFDGVSSDTDPLIHWVEPSWLDERAPLTEAAAREATTTPGARPTGSVLDTDWADRLETDGLPEIGSDPLAVPTPLPQRAAEHHDRFELIWPSGEIDDEFGEMTISEGEPDHDRVGPTARIVRAADQPSDGPIPEVDEQPGLWDFENTAPSFGPREEPAEEPTQEPAAAVTDELVLSMRRAVASIETGSLAARRRLAAEPMADSSRGIDLVVPGRVATRTESSLWSVRPTGTTAMRSVFDEVAVTPDAAPAQQQLPRTVTPDAAVVAHIDAVVAHVGAADGEHAVAADDEPERVSALRRLIGGLRRR